MDRLTIEGRHLWVELGLQVSIPSSINSTSEQSDRKMKLIKCMQINFWHDNGVTLKYHQ